MPVKETQSDLGYDHYLDAMGLPEDDSWIH